MIYFIRAVNSGAIKIGVSNDPRRRLESMQTGSPEPLELLGVLPGGVDEERRLHQRFAAYRIHGEWFRGDETLTRAIEVLTLKPIDELLDEKSAEAWLIMGELLCEAPEDWEQVTLFCVRRQVPDDRLFPDPDMALNGTRPGCRFRVINSIANVSSKPKYWPVPEDRVRRALAPDNWKPFVFDCDDHQSFPSRLPLSEGPVAAPVDPRPELVAGARVTHPQYGIGRIVTVDGNGPDRKGRVAFTVAGERIFVLARSPLELAPSPAQPRPGCAMKLPDWTREPLGGRDKPVPPDAN